MIQGVVLAGVLSLARGYLPDVNIFTNYRTEVYNGESYTRSNQKKKIQSCFLRHSIGDRYYAFCPDRR